MTSPSYEATIRLEQDIKHFSQKIGHKEHKLSQVIHHYQNKKKGQAFQISMLCNSALNIGLVLCLANWLL